MDARKNFNMQEIKVTLCKTMTKVYLKLILDDCVIQEFYKLFKFKISSDSFGPFIKIYF